MIKKLKTLEVICNENGWDIDQCVGTNNIKYHPCINSDMVKYFGTEIKVTDDGKYFRL